MELLREDWWASPVWYVDMPILDITNKSIEAECYRMMEQSEGRVISNIGGWQGLGNASCTNINQLINQINPLVRSVAKDYGIINSKFMAIKHDDYWININQPNTCNATHTHPTSLISGVFYVKCNDNSGSIKLENDAHKQYFNGTFLNNSNKLNYLDITYTPKVNRLILFPSWLAHSVTVNKSNEDRISIAFNA